MKLFALVLIIFSTNLYAEVYKCTQDNRQIYSQEPCGIDATVVKFENQSKPKEHEQHVLSAKSIKVITGKVIRVIDGDTIVIQTYAGKEKIRFAQIDAPETSHFGSRSQPYGKEAGQYLRKLVMNQSARVEVETIDQYGRNVGTVYVDGNNVNIALVKNGFAWVYRQYDHDSTLIDLEKAARSKRIGLWSLDNPIYPPDFRKVNK
ncbi:MAG: thermonuclease family protein [Methylococcales bacterium]|nr:thermonuclease family protein [Methylococcales bacterium]MDD5755012.1 thermonuclease family protein [Methylococcales bacterium]